MGVFCALIMLIDTRDSRASRAMGDQGDRGAVAAWSAEQVRAGLIEGVTQVAAPGVPGPLLVFGSQSCVAVVGGAEGGTLLPVVAAAHHGAGRIVAFGHTGYLDGNTLQSGQTGALLLNAIRWAAGATVPDAAAGNRRANGAGRHPAGSVEKPRIGLYRAAGAAECLRGGGLSCETLEGTNWLDRLPDIDVLCANVGDLRPKEIDAVGRYVRAGGGLVAVSLGWGWLQLNPGKTLADHPGNQLLAEAGIAWADGYLRPTSTTGFVAGAVPRLIHALDALDALREHATGKSSLSVLELAHAGRVATLVALHLGPADRQLRPKIDDLRRLRQEPIVPSESAPVHDRAALDRFLLTVDVADARRRAPADVRAHPAAAVFPGPVPRGTKRVVQGVSIDTRRNGWHSTGLYAPPGAPIEASVEEPDTAAAARGSLRLRIGAHTDLLWDKAEWKRVPEITCDTPFVAGVTRLASPMGGLVYVDVPEGCKLERATIRITGAVPAPRFVRGESTVEQWRSLDRLFKAPWGELESEKVILTLPAAVLRELDDPDEVLAHWERVSDAAADLAGIPRQRARPHRLVPDVQISAGYMHAGYPIMTHLDVQRAFVDLSALNDSDRAWGFYHELGHNHQSPDWTFEGTGEVTCNLFTLYILDTVAGLPPERTRMNDRACRDLIARYFDGGARFEDWKRDPFVALVMYVQMQAAFGWDAYRRIFAEYRDLPAADRPGTDDAKRDQWLVRMSRTVGKDLGPFFQAWGIPVSEAARQSISQLPDWMPPDFPPAKKQDRPPDR